MRGLHAPPAGFDLYAEHEPDTGERALPFPAGDDGHSKGRVVRCAGTGRLMRRPSRIANPHLRRMWAISYVIPKRKSAADVWFAEARALLSSPSATSSK